MNRSKAASLSLFTLVIIIWSACSSGKSAMEQGNYYEAVITAINRLRRNTDNKKSAETLRASYPLALRYYDDKANAALTSNAEFKWREVVQHYTTLHSMYDEIQRSPGALQVIPNPTSYQTKLTDARLKAAEESYNAGIMALGAGDRTNAKKAYHLFINASGYSPTYRDVARKIEEARLAATLKIAVEPIPVASKNYQLDAHYFDSKLNEFLQSNKSNEFIRYYKLEDARAQRINPDHIVQLSFEEFSIGQVYVNEKESQVERDSVVVAYAYTDVKGALLQKNIEAPKIVPLAGVTTATSSTDNTTVKVEETKPVTEVKPVVAATPAVTPVAETKPVAVVSPAVETKPVTEVKPVVVATPAAIPVVETKPIADTKPADQTAGNGTTSDDKKDKEEQIAICHQPAGKPSERKTLTLPKSAVQAHLDHGDVIGECKDDEKKNEKSNDKGSGNNDGKGSMVGLMSFSQRMPVMIASASNDNLWYLFSEENATADTTRIFGKVRATVHHYKKTITSRGVLNFRIIDAKTRAVISEERMPSEYVWISEWLTYNGDSRALSADQENLARQKEVQPPSSQDMFSEFTKPLFDQITNKITQFYRNY